MAMNYGKIGILLKYHMHTNQYLEYLINLAKKIGFLEIIFQSIATSIDALSIGFIYLSLPLIDAMVTFSVVGITTFVLSLLATILGKVIGSKIQKIAPFISAAIFLALSIKFLCEGLI